MAFQRILAVGGLGLLATGGVIAGVFLSRPAREPSRPLPVASTPATPETPDLQGDTLEMEAPPLPVAPPPVQAPFGPSPLGDILEDFDAVWAAPHHLHGDARAQALGQRTVQVDALVDKAVALGLDTVPEIRVRLHEAGVTYPRQMFLCRVLADLEGVKALRLLGDVALARNPWRLRDFAFRSLVESSGDQAVAVSSEYLARLEDPRFVLAVLGAPWQETEVEDAYRGWLDAAVTTARTRSYSFLVRADGDWIDDLLMDVAASEKPGLERAGAVNTLGVRGPEGALAFLRDLLWGEEDANVIKAIVGAIRRVGGEEGKAILAEYAAAGAPEALRPYVEAAARAPDLKPAGPGAAVMRSAPKTIDPGKGTAGEDR